MRDRIGRKWVMFGPGAGVKLGCADRLKDRTGSSKSLIWELHGDL